MLCNLYAQQILSRNLTPLTSMTKGKGKVKMIDTSEWNGNYMVLDIVQLSY